MGIPEKIEEIFGICCNSQGVVDFYGAAKYFWASLDNNLSLCDLAGVFTVVNPLDADVLNLQLFTQFVNGISRIKYPFELNVERFLADLQQPRPTVGKNSSSNFQRAMDKNVMRVLLKFDMPLRRVFSNFAGRDITVGGGLTWDEVKRMNIGMEVEGFVVFAGAHSLIPSCLTTQQCTTLARDVASQFPMYATVSSNNSILLYPQFQLLLCFTAIERYAMITKDNLSKYPKTTTQPMSTSTSIFNAKKVSHGTDSEYLADMLNDLLKAIGIDLGSGHSMAAVQARNMSSVVGRPSSASRRYSGTGNPGQRGRNSALGKGNLDDATGVTSKDTSSFARMPSDGDSTFVGEVNLPMSSKPEDSYSSSMKLERQAMLVRMDRIFDDIGEKLRKVTYTHAQLDPLLSSTVLYSTTDEHTKPDMQLKFASKPVVIGDAVPLPASCPAVVEQLLESSLAHHNLGSFQEALKFMEAARIQQEEYAIRHAEAKRIQLANAARGMADRTKAKAMVAAAKEGETGLSVAVNTDPTPPTPAQIEVDTRPPIDQELYIYLCKGNVYQSSGDDEQAIMMYIQGWDRAVTRQSSDWEVVCLNSIGLLCYFNLRYELALRCFSEVVAFRALNFASDSADTVTALNNMACCLYCLGRRGDARVRFEWAWNVMTKAIGARHPRTVVTWRNLDKARRSLSSLRYSNMKESLAMRADSEKLLVGGNFTIEAVASRPGSASRKKKGKGSKKKK